MTSGEIRELIELTLLSGKCVLLVGAPGTGKTRIAIEVSRDLTRSEPRIVVGRGDLSYEDLVYRYELRNGSTRIAWGELALSILASWIRLINGGPPIWLVLDEINRFNVDLVLGELFLGLDIEHRRRARVVPLDLLRAAIHDEDLHELLAAITKLDTVDVRRTLTQMGKAFSHYGYLPIPYLWRALATMNIVDRSHLHRLGFALLRRFPILIFPPLFKDFRSELNDEKIGFETAPVLEDTVHEALRELTLSSEDVGIPSDRVLYSISLSKESVLSALEEFKRVTRVFTHLAKEMSELGIDLGYSIYVDLYRLLTVAHLLNYRDEAKLADLAVSAFLLPHVGSIVPRLRAELLLMGRTKRIDRLSRLLDSVSSILGSDSRSAYYCEVLSLEVPAALH